MKTEKDSTGAEPAICKGVVSGSAFTIHDLKPGNIVNYHTAEGDIMPFEIDWQDLKWLTEDPDGFNLVHSPISVNMEILSRFGFEIVDVKYAVMKIANNWQLEYFDNSLGFSLCKGKRGLCIGEIKYVHQLQNLWYDLTREMKFLS